MLPLATWLLWSAILQVCGFNPLRRAMSRVEIGSRNEEARTQEAGFLNRLFSSKRRYADLGHCRPSIKSSQRWNPVYRPLLSAGQPVLLCLRSRIRQCPKRWFAMRRWEGAEN